MAPATVIQKLIGGVVYTYDRELDVISEGPAANSSVLNRTQVNTPVDLCVEYTTWCNISCGNCFSESQAGCRGTHALPREVAKHVERESASIIRVCVTGGEPLLHPEIAELISLPERVEDCGFVMSTNGTVRDDLDGLLIAHKWLAGVSLHGARETHNKYTNSTTFDIVRRRIEKLAPAATTHIYTVLHNELTHQDVDWLIRFRNDAGARFLRFVVPRSFGRYIPFSNKELLRYVESRCDSRSAVKRERSLTRFLSVSGDLRLTA